VWALPRVGLVVASAGLSNDALVMPRVGGVLGANVRTDVDHGVKNI